MLISCTNTLCRIRLAWCYSPGFDILFLFISYILFSSFRFREPIIASCYILPQGAIGLRMVVFFFLCEMHAFVFILHFPTRSCPSCLDIYFSPFRILDWCSQTFLMNNKCVVFVYNTGCSTFHHGMRFPSCSAFIARCECICFLSFILQHGLVLLAWIFVFLHFVF